MNFYKMRVCSSVLLLMVCGTRGYLLPESRRDFMRQVSVSGIQQMTLPPRDRRSSHTTHRIIDPISSPSDCFLVYPDEGELFYKAATNDAPVCGIYMIAPQNKKIELVFNYLDVPCEDGGIVEWVDGWQLNGEVWPAEGWSDERSAEECGQGRPRRVFEAQQNAALLQYRVPVRGQGFSVRVRHVHSVRPCNVMIYGESGVHTLRNYGTARNCSVVAVGPAAVQILDMDVGRPTKHPNSIEVETGTIRQCSKRRLPDHVDIGGSPGLDNTKMEVLDSLCGLNSNEDSRPALVGCANTVVRLVSSGRYHNSVTVSFQPLPIEEISSADLICDI